jgi:hypothetical protein
MGLVYLSPFLHYSFIEFRDLCLLVILILCRIVYSLRNFMFKLSAWYFWINGKILIEIRDLTDYFEVRSQPCRETTEIDFFIVSIGLSVLNTTEDDRNWSLQNWILWLPLTFAESCELQLMPDSFNVTLHEELHVFCGRLERKLPDVYRRRMFRRKVVERKTSYVQGTDCIRPTIPGDNCTKET